jgi:hypothetical protein
MILERIQTRWLDAASTVLSLLHLASQSDPCVLIVLAIAICVPILLCVSPSFFPAPHVSLKYSGIGFQIGMFRPIRVDHTNCLQVAIKTHSFICTSPHATMCMTLSRSIYTCVLILLSYVSSYYYVCHLVLLSRSICVRILLYICLHTTTCVSPPPGKQGLQGPLGGAT